MHQKYITRWRSDNIFLIHNADIPSQSTSMNSCRSQTIFVQSFLFFSQLSKNLHHPPCISRASGKPRDRVPLPQIKSGENLLNKRKTPASELHVSILWIWLAWRTSFRYRIMQGFVLIHKISLFEHLRCEFDILCIVFNKVLYILVS